MGLFAKKKSAGGAFSPEQQNFLDAFDGSSDDDDILSPDQRELAKVSVDMTLAGPRLDTPPLLESDSDSVASDDEGTSYTVEAPSGKLGVAFESRKSTIVREVFFDSPLVGEIRPGDTLQSVNGIQVNGANYLIHVAAADNGTSRKLGFIRGKRRTPVVSPPKRRRSVIIQKGTLVELLAADEVETLVQFREPEAFTDAHKRCCGGVFTVLEHSLERDALRLDCPTEPLWFPRQACVVDTWTNADDLSGDLQRVSLDGSGDWY